MNKNKLPNNLRTMLGKYNIAFAVPSTTLEYMDKKFIAAIQSRDIEKVKELASGLTRINVNITAPLYSGYQFVRDMVWYQRVNAGKIYRSYIGTDISIVDYLRSILYK